jgi:hypothetical protein
MPPRPTRDLPEVVMRMSGWKTSITVAGDLLSNIPPKKNSKKPLSLAQYRKPCASTIAVFNNKTHSFDISLGLEVYKPSTSVSNSTSSTLSSTPMIAARESLSQKIILFSSRKGVDLD